MSPKKRKSQRLEWMGSVYKKGDVATSLGLILDFSERGVKLWVDSYKVPEEEIFTIRLLPPGGTHITHSLDFEVHKVWSTIPKSTNYTKVGCEFTNLTSQQKEYLEKLKTYFETLNDQEPANHNFSIL